VAALWLKPLATYQKPIAFAAALTGLLAVACSAMIYADTHREFWSVRLCLGRFFGTTLLLGTATSLALGGPASLPFITFLVAVTAAKLAFEHRITRHFVDVDALTLTCLQKTARLLEDELGQAARLRVACAIIGGVALPVMSALNNSGPSFAFLGGLLCLTGEFLERYLFFTAVVPVKMPGGIAS
jgi:DMSO reductase anchor subunit